MLYVMTMSWHPGLTRAERDAVLARRAGWAYPSGVTVLGEYWTAAEDPAIVVVFEADRYAPIMEVTLTWNDAFRIATSPAVTVEEGLELGPAILERRGT